MIRKTFYTLWKSNEDNPDEDAILLDGESIYYFRTNAFKRARELAKELADGWGYAILVRRITIGCDECTEWIFEHESH